MASGMLSMCCNISNAHMSGDRMRRGARSCYRSKVMLFAASADGPQWAPLPRLYARSDDLNVASVGMSGAIDSFQRSRR